MKKIKVQATLTENRRTQTKSYRKEASQLNKNKRRISLKIVREYIKNILIKTIQLIKLYIFM